MSKDYKSAQRKFPNSSFLASALARSQEIRKASVKLDQLEAKVDEASRTGNEQKTQVLKYDAIPDQAMVISNYRRLEALADAKLVIGFCSTEV